MYGGSTQAVRTASVMALRQQYAPACDFRTELGKELGEEEGTTAQGLVGSSKAVIFC